VVGGGMIAWKALPCYESNRTSGEAALDGCLFLLTNDGDETVMNSDVFN
jgi:hypothetical protein